MVKTNHYRSSQEKLIGDKMISHGQKKSMKIVDLQETTRGDKSTRDTTIWQFHEWLGPHHYNKTLWLVSLLASFLVPTITFSVCSIIFSTKWMLF